MASIGPCLGLNIVHVSCFYHCSSDFFIGDLFIWANLCNLLQAVPFLVGCPACLRNFLNLFCELSCSPNQSQFINVTSVSEVRP